MSVTLEKSISSHAATAKAVRAVLKERFPGHKFSVTSESFANGDAVRVRWTDGPTRREVENVVDVYQYGHFDGMVDMYEYSNWRTDIPQVKFVSCSRSMSDARFRECVEAVNELYSVDLQLVETNYGLAFDEASRVMPGPGNWGWMTSEVNNYFYERAYPPNK